MKKFTTMVLVAGAIALPSLAGYRIVEDQPGTNNVMSIKITSVSQLASISPYVSATGETNSFTITNLSVDDSVTYTYAPAVADIIQGTANNGKAVVYNTDQDTTTYHTEWLKVGDTLKLTGNDGTPTAYSNVTYRVVLKTVD